MPSKANILADDGVFSTEELPETECFIPDKKTKYNIPDVYIRLPAVCRRIKRASFGKSGFMRGIESSMNYTIIKIIK